MTDPVDVAMAKSTFELLFRTARVVNEAAIERVRSAGELEGVRPAHTTLFPHISREGSRITDIAAKLGVSKQAVAQLVDELVEMGGLERVPDPTDGRAKLVRFRDGALLHGLNELRVFEDEIAARLAPDSMADLHRLLSDLLGALGPAPT